MQNAVGGEAVISFVQQQHVGICFTGCLAKGNYDSGLLAMGSFPPSKKGSLKEKGRREVREAVEGGERGPFLQLFRSARAAWNTFVR